MDGLDAGRRRRARLGNYAAAIEHLITARDLVSRTREKLDAASPAITAFRLGVTYLRMGETENCLLNPAATSCILPIRARRFTRDRPDPGRPSPRSPTC